MKVLTTSPTTSITLGLRQEKKNPLRLTPPGLDLANMVRMRALVCVNLCVCCVCVNEYKKPLILRFYTVMTF